MSLARVLLVDDEPQLLEGLRRQLRKRFEIEIAVGPLEAIEKISSSSPFAVVVSDMRMPIMSGVELLDRCKEITPDSTRIMLTGNSDQTTVVEAINRGSVFRFLNKPCDSVDLARAIDEGIAHHRLKTLERDVMVRTVSGSIGLLTDLIGLLQPMLARRSNRIRTLVVQLIEKIPSKNDWEIRIASNLCEIGCMAIDPEIIGKISNSVTLARDEQAEFRRHAEIGKKLIAKIPRLEGVAEMVGNQFSSFESIQRSTERELELAMGSNILKIASDFEQARTGARSVQDSIKAITAMSKSYSPVVYSAFLEVMKRTEEIRMLKVTELENGMIIEEDIHSMRGDLLVAKGQTVVCSLRERLLMFAQSSQQVREPFRVRCQTSSP